MNIGVSMVRIKHWTDVVKVANTSGMKKNEWCEKNGINLNTFYYWQRRICDFALSGLIQPDDNVLEDLECRTDPTEFLEFSMKQTPLSIQVSTDDEPESCGALPSQVSSLHIDIHYGDSLSIYMTDFPSRH